MDSLVFAQGSGFVSYLTTLVGNASDLAYSYIVIGLLILVGSVATVMTRFMQFRFLGDMVKAVFSSRAGAEGGISGFQAFAIGLAERVGTGNVVGVAIAILLGGPGAVFWMWLIALLGMATGLVEATLAQAYKVRGPDGTFRGGPAWYIKKGIGSSKMGGVIAVLVIFTFAISYVMIHSNVIAKSLNGAWDIPSWVSAVFLVIMCSPLLLGGLKTVARITEVIAPLMALIYMLVAISIVVIHITEFPAMIIHIIESAFGFGPAAGGVTGGVTAAMLNGVRRGLFSNEAGIGSVPNAAATATVAHPIQQGLIQAFGVFVDTVVLCTCTAFIILIGGVYTGPDGAEGLDGSTLTALSVAETLGEWSIPLMTALLFTFAYSSILGSFAFAEVNTYYLLGDKSGKNIPLRVAMIICVVVGSLARADIVWNLGDLSQAMMAVVNLIAILMLFRVFQGILRDYESQRQLVKRGDLNELSYRGIDNDHMEADIPTDVWVRTDGLTPLGVRREDTQRQVEGNS